MHRRLAILASLLIFVCMSVGCSTKLPDEASDNSAPLKSSRWFGKKEVTIPAGTIITVRLANAVGAMWLLSPHIDPVATDNRTFLQDVEL